MVELGKLKVWVNRGSGRYVVQEGETFYLVDLYKKEATKAEPPESPDIFIKAGYFEDTNELTPIKGEEILAAFKNKRENPARDPDRPQR